MSDFPTIPSLINTIEYRLHKEYVRHPSEPSKPQEFEPKRIIHRVLTVRPSAPFPGSLGQNDELKYEFDIRRLTQAAPDPDTDPPMGEGDEIATGSGALTPAQQVEQFIKYKIGKGSDFDSIPKAQPFVVDPTPYDIPVRQQCFVILELDRKLKWQFAKGSSGITTKDFHGTDNFGMTFLKNKLGSSVLQFSDPLTEPLITIDDCKLIYFRVGRRRGDNQLLNFHIEFEWGDDRKFIQLIFDPSLPNDGGASFP